MLASNVGGLPELIDERWLFPKNDSNAIAAGIGAIMNAADKTALDNFGKAKKFDSALLTESKNSFYSSYAYAVKISQNRKNNRYSENE